jgi:predicted dehydrogenase
MIKVGIVGIGFMGLIHYLAYQKVKNAQVTAITSRSPKKREGDWRGIKGNFGPEGTKIELGDISRYETIDQMLDDPEVDMVDICLPTSFHPDASIKALQAGKHVLCEKPISMTMDDADRMVKTSEEAGKLLMIAQVLPFFPEYAYVQDVVDRGIYGKILGGYFKRIVADPKWIVDYWDPVKGGGPLIDLHIHDAHFIRVICGMPEKVYTRGWMRGEVVQFAITEFIYGNSSPIITAASGAIDQQGRPFNQAFELYLEKATITFEVANLTSGPQPAIPLTLLTNDGKVTQPELPGSGDIVDAFVAELNEAVRACEANSPSPLLNGILARDALVLCHLQTESAKKGDFVVTR